MKTTYDDTIRRCIPRKGAIWEHHFAQSRTRQCDSSSPIVATITRVESIHHIPRLERCLLLIVLELEQQ